VLDAIHGEESKGMLSPSIAASCTIQVKVVELAPPFFLLLSFLFFKAHGYCIEQTSKGHWAPDRGCKHTFPEDLVPDAS
jgi:hypothetical protein